MSTTNLFVELIVIGLGSFIWICELIFIIFNIKVPFDTSFITNINAVTVIPIMGFIYVIGIATDRISDYLAMKIWGNKCRKKIFIDDEEYYQLLNIISVKYEKVSTVIEYSKSRIRILRGWMFQLIIIEVLTTVILVQQKIANTPFEIAVLNVLFILLIVLIWFSWYKTQETTFKKLKTLSEQLDI